MKTQWKFLEPNAPSVLKLAQVLNMVQPFPVNMYCISQSWGDRKLKVEGRGEPVYEKIKNASSIRLGKSYFAQRWPDVLNRDC